MRAEVANREGELRPGQFVRVRVIGAQRTRAITVPQEAVIQGQRGESVWTVDKDNKAQSRAIEVAEWTEGNWVVRSGLREGDVVIVDGTVRLAPGAPVRPTPAAAKPASASAPAAQPGPGGKAAP
ncbi:Efflux pump periplasmic linker BepD precursor [compost metagenome]